MKHVKTKVVTKLENDNINIYLWYVTLNSPNYVGICMFEYEGEIYIIDVSDTSYDIYTNIISLFIKDSDQLDIFYIRKLMSEGWSFNNKINVSIIKQLREDINERDY